MPIEISWRESGKTGAGDEKRLLEGEGPFKIGRAATGDIVLDHPQVSRLHAEVNVDGLTSTS